MSPNLETLRKRVEKETVQGHSWDTVVPLLLMQELIEVSSQVAQLNKVLAEILADARRNEPAQDATPSPGTAERTGRVEEGVRKSRGRPRKGG